MRQANAARRLCMKHPRVDCSKILNFFPPVDCIEGFAEGAYCLCDCDGYRPDTLGGNTRVKPACALPDSDIGQPAGRENDLP